MKKILFFAMLFPLMLTIQISAKDDVTPEPCVPKESVGKALLGVLKAGGFFGPIKFIQWISQPKCDKKEDGG